MDLNRIYHDRSVYNGHTTNEYLGDSENYKTGKEYDNRKVVNTHDGDNGNNAFPGDKLLDKLKGNKNDPERESE